MSTKKSWKCLECDKTFGYGDWNCPDGRKHAVEAKTYFSPAENLRTYVVEERLITTMDGRQQMRPARSVEFVKGQYNTSDPEDQYALDVEDGLITQEQWRVRYISLEERLAQRERELKSREERLKASENEYLDKVKETVGAGKK